MSTPLISKNAILWYNAAAIAYLKDVSISASMDTIKDYQTSSFDPAVLESGNSTYKITAKKMYIDKTYFDLMKAGTKMTLEVRPSGTGTGKEKYTLTNCIFFDWKLSYSAGGIILEDLAGEAATLAVGTQT